MKKIICLLLALAALALIGGALAESYETPAPWELSTGYTQDDTIDLTPVINAAVGLLGEILVAVVAVVVLPPLKRWMQAHASKQQQDRFLTLVRELVLAAEQIFVKQGMGSDKMDWVIGQLKARGYDADVPMIEAAVHGMNMSVLQVFESELGVVEEPPANADEFN